MGTVISQSNVINMAFCVLIVKKWFHTNCQAISFSEYRRLYYECPDEKWNCLICCLPSFCDSLFTDDCLEKESQNEDRLKENYLKVTRVTPEKQAIARVIQPNLRDENTSLYQEFEEKFKIKGLHFLHLNVRSILNKISELRIPFKRKRLSIIAFTETWLNNSINDEEIEIDGYKSYAMIDPLALEVVYVSISEMILHLILWML